MPTQSCEQETTPRLSRRELLEWAAKGAKIAAAAPPKPPTGKKETPKPELPPVETARIPELDSKKLTVALVYGGSGSWGTLGPIKEAPAAIIKAREYAGNVDKWNGSKIVLPCLNPALRVKGWTIVDTWLRATEKLADPIPVMVDISSAESDIEGKIEKIGGYRYGWVDLDCEFRKGGVPVSFINKLTQSFFDLRAQNGFTEPAIFALYMWRASTLVWDVKNLLWDFGKRGYVVPIYDGHGAIAAKMNGTKQVLSKFSGPIGTMEFVTKWGGRPDYGDPGLNRERYLQDIDKWAEGRLLIYASQ